MLLRDNGMPRVQIVTDPKAIEPYGKTRCACPRPGTMTGRASGPLRAGAHRGGHPGPFCPEERRGSSRPRRRGHFRLHRRLGRPPAGPVGGRGAFHPLPGAHPPPLVCSRRSDASLPSARRENAPAHSWAGGSAGADAAGGAARFFLRRRHTARTTAAAAASTSRPSTMR